MQKKIYILPFTAITLFALTLILLLYNGIQFEIAFIWLLLSSLNINFDILPNNVIDTPYVFIANLVGGFIFAFIAVFFGAFFFNLINRVGINEKKVLKKVKKMKGHIIIAPSNNFAETLKEEFEKSEIKYVMISGKKEDTNRLRRRGFIVITADPKDKESFELAGIKEAKQIIACSDEDIENIMITVAARAANAKAKIISRISNIDDISKLGSAGAYRMIMPEITTGEEIGEMLIKKFVENV
ncbi:MAG: NAD-binding protein [Candidatus Marsarchaeota archaeon]|nr:NAD-binding protein [Candidatus Marsarchaeota archaeon]